MTSPMDPTRVLPDTPLARYISRLWDMLEMAGTPPWDPAASVFDDWGLDSVQIFQLVLYTEAMAEIDVPPPDIPEIHTAGDAYAYYRFLLDTRVD